MTKDDAESMIADLRSLEALRQKITPMDSSVADKLSKVQDAVASVGATCEILFDNGVSVGIRINGDGSSAQYGLGKYGLTQTSPGSVHDKLLARAIRAAKKASK